MKDETTKQRRPRRPRRPSFQAQMEQLGKDLVTFISHIQTFSGAPPDWHPRWQPLFHALDTATTISMGLATAATHDEGSPPDEKPGDRALRRGYIAGSTFRLMHQLVLIQRLVPQILKEIADDMNAARSKPHSNGKHPRKS